MLLEETTQNASKSTGGKHNDTENMTQIKSKQQEHATKLYDDTFNIGESYLAGPWHIRQHDLKPFAILDYSHTESHLCGEYSKTGPDEFIHHDRRTHWQTDGKRSMQE